MISLAQRVLSSKIYESADNATADIKDGMILKAGGFGLCGIPENLIGVIEKQGIKDLTVVLNNCGDGRYPLQKLQLSATYGSFS